jgi:predicted acyl esterase
MKQITLFASLILSCHLNSQVNLNGELDAIEELSRKETTSIPMSDGTNLEMDVYLPILQDSVVIPLDLGGTVYNIQLIERGQQYVIYDSVFQGNSSYAMPFIFTRTPYNKDGDDYGGYAFPFLGYGYAIQNMRGRYSSEGAYFPMYSDSWQKAPYNPSIQLPFDITSSSDPSNANFHEDGKTSVLFMSNQLNRIEDLDGDGLMDTIPLINDNIGTYGASALGNSQYQGVSAVPHSLSHDVKCIMPVVATNEHYETTSFNNGVYRTSLTDGWVTGQINSGVDDGLNSSDFSIYNNLHSSNDYGYSDKAVLTDDILEFMVEKSPGAGLPSGAYPNSPLRLNLDGSFAPVDASGESSATGAYSRYDNLYMPSYNVTGWWDIFINGQIETFNKIRAQHPTQKNHLIIGPWAHQTIGEDSTGHVKYPSSVKDVMGDINSEFDFGSSSSNGDIVASLFNKDLVHFFREYLGGEPYFFIKESDLWQNAGALSLRVPASNYVIPYSEFINFLTGQDSLMNLPVEIDNGTTTAVIFYDIPPPSPAVISSSQPILPHSTGHFNDHKAVQAYITGPVNDGVNVGVGNFWLGIDSLPVYQGVNYTKFYMHQNGVLDENVPTSNEGLLSYTSDPNNPVITCGGNNMIPDLPTSPRNAQGAIQLNEPSLVPYTYSRADILHFETVALTDTMMVLGFPKAAMYVGALPSNALPETNFDVVLRLADIYPNGDSYFVTEGVVNARYRAYAKSIFEGDTNNNVAINNVISGTKYYLEFDMLPLGHTFGVGHKIEVLLSSTDFPRYQSNPHIPLEAGEFFRWNPGDTAGYVFNGSYVYANSASIEYEFNAANPNYISLPVVEEIVYNSVDEDQTVRLEVFPVPSSDEVLLQTEGAFGFQVFDLTGRQMTDYITCDESFNLKVSNWSNGIYLVKANQSGINRTITKRIVVSK